jgi:alkyl hydroperoxide reductase subunit D
MTAALDRLREQLPAYAKDIQLNLSSVLETTSLDERSRWGVALASAYASGSVALREAIESDSGAFVDEAVVDDAHAAAALMAMNNVFYRFRHFIGKASYQTKPARLRMNRMAQPRSDKLLFELMSLAVSAINGCETCVRSHEQVVVTGGLSEDQVHDAVRIAATIRAAAVALGG